ncbi:hypothetical protein TNCV_3131591, partial [Trichonephila clavipes]
ALLLLSSFVSNSNSSTTPSMVIGRFALIKSPTFLKRSSTTFLDTGKCQHDRFPDPDTHGTTHGGQPGTSRALP